MNCAPCITRLFSVHLACPVPEKGVSGTEYPFRTVEAYFLHRMPQKMRRVPEEACFLHGAHIPYRRRPSPVPNSANARKEESIACTECFKRQKGEGHCPEHDPECRREQENNSLRPQNTNALHNLPVTTATHPTTSIHSHLPSHHSYTPSYTLGQQKTPPASTVTTQAVRKVRFSKCNRPSGPFWQG